MWISIRHKSQYLFSSTLLDTASLEFSVVLLANLNMVALPLYYDIKLERIDL